MEFRLPLISAGSAEKGLFMAPKTPQFFPEILGISQLQLFRRYPYLVEGTPDISSKTHFWDLEGMKYER